MQMDGTYVGSVVLSGLGIVFLALILLIFFVWLMDKVFSAIKGSGSKPAAAENKPAEKPALSIPPAAPPAVENGISGEVVAVIAAAVAALGAESGKTFRLKSVSRSGSNRRGAWGNASAAENTRPF